MRWAVRESRSNIDMHAVHACHSSYKKVAQARTKLRLLRGARAAVRARLGVSQIASAKGLSSRLSGGVSRPPRILFSVTGVSFGTVLWCDCVAWPGDANRAESLEAGGHVRCCVRRPSVTNDGCTRFHQGRRHVDAWGVTVNDVRGQGAMPLFAGPRPEAVAQELRERLARSKFLKMELVEMMRPLVAAAAGFCSIHDAAAPACT